MSEFREILYDP